MNWRFWQRDPPARDSSVDAAEAAARRLESDSKSQAPKVAAAEKAAKALARQTERLAAEVDSVMRLRGTM